MKRFAMFSLSIILSLILAVSSVEGVFAAQSTPDEAPIPETIEIKASDIAKNSFNSEVQSALDFARDKADENHIIKIKVAPGEYELDRVLQMYSNTTLSLYGVTIKRAKDARVNMIRLGEINDYSEGVTGYYYKNIAIEGGFFDADTTPCTMLKIAHGENFSMTDVTVGNNLNSHMMEVAGIDGFTLKNCTFKNQQNESLESPNVCYEAVQFDVLKKGHISDSRSEDIPMKNVLVEGCHFENCPRGVGSHTAILNIPFENMIIKNNTFKNLTSVAVQEMGWVNCDISDNYFENMPRAIAVYAVGSKGSGMILPSVIAKEGNTESHASDDYIAPRDFKTVIENNTIRGCGSIKDIHATYGVSAISTIGYNLTEVYSSGADDSGGLPKGNYYVNGVKIRNNFIEINGTGCRIEDTKNIEITSNTIYCGANIYFPTSNYHGIMARYNAQVKAISNNYIKNAKINGIYVATGCSITKIDYNNVNGAAKYGILLNDSPADTICDNIVSDIKISGIAVKKNGEVKNPVLRNKVFGCTSGIEISSKAKAFVNSNVFKKCAKTLKYSKMALLTKTTLGTNYATTSAVSGISNDVKAVEISKGRTYKLKTTITPINGDTKITYTSSDTNVASVNSFGLITANNPGSANITVKTANSKTAVVSVTVNEQQADTKTTASLAVTRATSVYNITGGVMVKWIKTPGAVKYVLFKKWSGTQFVKTAETTALSYVDKTVVSGRVYTYTVRAVAADGKYIGYYDTTGCSLTYFASAKIKTLKNGKGNITLTWDKVQGIAQYRLFYKVNNSAWQSFGTTSKTQKVLSKAVSGTDYTFLIVSLDGNKNPMNMFGKTGWKRRYLSKPSLKKIKVKGKKINLSWRRIAGANKYVIKVKASPKADKSKKTKAKAKWKTLKPILNNNKFIYNGKYGRTYKFMLKCCDLSGKQNSMYSDCKKIKVKKKNK